MEPVKEEQRTARKHRNTKFLIVTVGVPVLVTLIHITAGQVSNNPLGVIITITDGILFSHLALFLYERYVEHKLPIANQEEIIQMRFELDLIKEILDDAGLSDMHEIEVTASIEREVLQTIINEEAEEG